MKTWAAFSPFFLTATQFTKMENQVNKFLFGLFLAAFSFLCHAVNIQNNSIESFNTTNIGEVTVITFNGISFSVVNVPTIASQFENSDSTATHTKLKAKLPLGELVMRQEVEAVIKAYYEKNAFDSTSISIRNLIVRTNLSWSIWCTNPWIFGCLEWLGSGGTWVEFEANGRNRSGGLSGYQRTIWMVRKFS